MPKESRSILNAVLDTSVPKEAIIKSFNLTPNRNNSSPSVYIEGADYTECPFFQEKVILSLLEEGYGLRQVARVSGLSKGLVESYKRRAKIVDENGHL